MKNPRPPMLCLVSNDLQLTYLINRYAENCGCRLTQVGLAEPLLADLSKAQVDLIMLDVTQVDRESWAVINKLKSTADRCEIPLVLYSANDIAWQAGELDGYKRLSHSVLFEEFKQVVIESGIHIPNEGRGG
jgi:CheY-like chemotaxis protein